MRASSLVCVSAVFIAAAGAGSMNGRGSDFAPIEMLQALTAQMDARLALYPLQTAAAGVLFLAAWIVCLVPSTVIELWLGYQFGLWRGFLLVYAGKARPAF